MTTAQQSSNGHKACPPPCSVENPAELNRPDLPTDKADNNQPANVDPIIERQKGPFAANAYHVPPTRYAPKANSYRYDDFPSAEIDTSPLPERCQFMFSDGRQCTMARSDIHPSLCRFHAEREDQLFGSPVSGGNVAGAAFDLPELYSACGDLTTAAGVNRALAQVFRLFAQRRISRQEAATFGHLAQLLLRSISLARSSRESLLAANVYHPPQKGYQQDALFAGDKDELRGVKRSAQELSRVKEVDEAPGYEAVERHAKRSPEQETTRGNVILSESDLPSGERLSTGCALGGSQSRAFAGQQSRESKDLSASPPVNGAPVQCSPGSSPTSTRTPSEGDVLDVSCNRHLNGTNSNSRTISTYKNVEHKPIQNQHLHKNGFHRARKSRPIG